MKKGFTLTELMIAIAVLSILAAIALPQLNGMRVKSRDAQRLSDIRKLQVALESYRNAHNQYPATAPGGGSVTVAVSGDVSCYPATNENPVSFESSGLVDLVSGGFLNSLPKDPINRDFSCYLYLRGTTCNGGGQTSSYRLAFKPEDMSTFGDVDDLKPLRGSEGEVEGWLCIDSTL